MGRSIQGRLESEGTSQALAATLVLVAAVGLAYLPILTLPAGFIWDDDMYVTENAALRSAGGLADLWLRPGTTPQYYPLVFTTFWIEHRIWGVDPVGYHATNLVLHALGAVLVWLVLRRLGLAGAWVAALVFAVHPVHVESVAWVTERKNVLSGALYLLSLLVSLRLFGLTGKAGAERVPLRTYALALALFIAALFAKTVTATLPVAILLLIWWKRGRIDRREVVWLVPFFAVGIGFGLGTIWMERFSVGAIGETWDRPLGERVLVAGRAFWFYLGKLAWPHELTFIYPKWSVSTSALRQWAFPAAAAIALASLALALRKIGRGPLVAALFFIVTLAPALGFFAVFPFRYSFVADHFQYLASLGPIACALAIAATLARRGATNGMLAGRVAGIALVVSLAALTRAQCRIYEGEETLWRDTLEKNPECWLAANNLGKILYGNGRTDDALPLLLRAQSIEPDFPESNFNLGYVLSVLGRIPEAEVALERALRVNPRHVGAHERLGALLFRQGRLDAAIEHLAEAARLTPAAAQRRVSLGIALLRSGRTDAGLAQLEVAVRLAPDDARIRATRDAEIVLARSASEHSGGESNRSPLGPDLE